MRGRGLIVAVTVGLLTLLADVVIFHDRVNTLLHRHHVQATPSDLPFAGNINSNGNSNDASRPGSRQLSSNFNGGKPANTAGRVQVVGAAAANLVPAAATTTATTSTVTTVTPSPPPPPPPPPRTTKSANIPNPCPPNHICRGGKAFRLPHTLAPQSKATPAAQALVPHQEPTDRVVISKPPANIDQRLANWVQRGGQLFVDPSTDHYRHLQHVSRDMHVLTMLSDAYLRGHQVFMRSLLQFNPWFTSQLVVLDMGLSEAARRLCRQVYPRTVFIKPKYDNYNMEKMTEVRSRHASLRLCYYKLDAFSLQNITRLITIDTGDMLVLGDLSDLFLDTSYDFGAVAASLSKRYSDFFGHPYFNAGLLVVGKRYLNPKTYWGLINQAETMPAPPSNMDDHNDQDVLNKYFKKPRILPKAYNAEKRTWGIRRPTHFVEFEDARILHFVGGKPWQLVNRASHDFGYRALENLWWSVAARNSVVVLGNAPSVTAVEAGYIIDQFPRVVRLTNFQIKGFERYVGTRTDDVFITFATKPADYSIVKESRIHLFAAERRDNIPWLKKRIAQPNGPQVDVDKVDLLPEYYYLGLNAKLGLTGKERASSGAIALEWLLKNFDGDIYTHGIDFFKGQGDKLKHYMPGHVSPRDGYHNFEKETTYFKQLYDTQRIRRLVV